MLRFLLLGVRVLYRVEEFTRIVMLVVVLPAVEICVGGYSFKLFAAVLAVSPVIAAADPLGGAAIRGTVAQDAAVGNWNRLTLEVLWQG